MQNNITTLFCISLNILIILFNIMYYHEEISKFTEEELISCSLSKEEIIDDLNSIKNI